MSSQHYADPFGSFTPAVDPAEEDAAKVAEEASRAADEKKAAAAEKRADKKKADAAEDRREAAAEKRAETAAARRVKKKVQVPSVGRIVHYVFRAPGYGEELVDRPAIIVKVWQPGEVNSSVQLQVFMDGDGGTANDGQPNVVWRTSATFDGERRGVNTWHWPEHVPEVEIEVVAED